MASKVAAQGDSIENNPTTTSGDLQIDAEESETAQLWLKWCRSNKDVKCEDSEVPAGILPQQYQGTIIDVKVHGRGPDDQIYGKHPDLRNKVARGNCVLELQKKGTKKIYYIFMIFALKKFSGGMGDEDDSSGYQNLWQNFFLQAKEKAVKVVCTKKANGEAAHASSRKFFNQDFFCVGSKNVHLLAKCKEDIEKYTDSRYMVAKTVAETFFSQIINNSSMKPDNLQRFVQYLQQEKCTMVCEILQPDYQHVENLSHLKNPEILFICWTSYKLIEEENTLCHKCPDIAIEEARDFGLLTVDYEVIAAESAEDYMAKIRSEFGYEGRVLYFLDEKNNVIGVLKKKTAWYIILRAIREKMCHFCSKRDNLSLAEKRKKITKRIAEIQTWIGFGDQYLQSWTKLGIGFMDWLLNEYKGQKDHMAVRSKFPILWQSFLDGNQTICHCWTMANWQYSSSQISTMLDLCKHKHNNTMLIHDMTESKK